MKKTILAAALLFSGTAMFAQTKFGFKAGLNFSEGQMEENIMFSSKSSSQVLLNATLFSDVTLSDRLAFQPGLSLTGKGFKVIYSAPTDGSFAALRSLNAYYIEVPLNIVAKFDAGTGKAFVGAGPYASVAMFGKKRFNNYIGGAGSPGTLLNETSDGYTKVGTSNKADFNPTDFGVNIIAGYQLINGISLNAGYGLGLTNTSPESSKYQISRESKNRVFSLSVGVML